MIEQDAVVLSVTSAIAEVEVQRSSGCGSCSARAGCGVSLLDRVLGRRAQTMLVRDELGVHPGEAVIVGMPEGALLQAAVAAYLVPLVGLLGGALLGELWLGGADVRSAIPLITGGIGLVFGLAVTRVVGRRLGADPRWRAVLLRRRAAPAAVAVRLPDPG